MTIPDRLSSAHSELRAQLSVMHSELMIQVWRPAIRGARLELIAHVAIHDYLDAANGLIVDGITAAVLGD